MEISSEDKKVERTFIIGDEWLYYKLYSGHKTADLILTEIIKPVTDKLLTNNIINKWFFIRYSDPKQHLRVRFHYKNPEHISLIIHTVNSSIKKFVDYDMIWKVQVDTYQREIERYGKNSIDFAEELFFHDSQMIVNILDEIEGDEGEVIRWLFSLRAIDSLLDDFKFTLEKKLELLRVLKDNFGKEFGKNTFLVNQLAKKYRKERPAINKILNRLKDDTNEMNPLFLILRRKSEDIKTIVEGIFNLQKNNILHQHLNELMGSYIHMMMNRIFKSKQRLHEMVIYDYLFRYYKSEVAKIKYNK